MKVQTIVLGAGMVGVSAALHLQARGRGVAIVDRRGPAEETSHGNAGIIQREAAEPYMFPRGDWAKILKYALNRLPEANLHYSALPGLLPKLFRFWRLSTPERAAASARATISLVAHCLAEHQALAEAAGVAGMLRPSGYLVVHRDPATLAKTIAEHERLKRDYGRGFEALDAAALARLEPHLKPVLAGGIYFPDPVTVGDPGGLGKAYAELFIKRGGRIFRGEARTLSRTASGWSVMSAEGLIEADQIVVALGPWSDLVLKTLGLKVPMFVKRGYHRHYRAEGNATLGRPVIDAANGVALNPMARGIRLTTGAEFAYADAPPTPVQLTKTEPRAREIFPLAETLDETPWLGRRPCLPDMLPVIGPAPSHPGLWLAFGHQHWGFTLGPVTGRLIAEMMTGAAPIADPHPFRLNRF